MRMDRAPLFALAACLILLLGSGCPKKNIPPSPVPSPEASPSPLPEDRVVLFGSEGAFAEPEAESRFSLALEGSILSPPLIVGGDLACAAEDRLVILEKGGSRRSIGLPGNCRRLVCGYEGGGKSYIVAELSEGGILCVDAGSLATVAERKEGGISCASGRELLRASGAKLERLALPGLSTLASAEGSEKIEMLASNGIDCLAFCGGVSLSCARFLDAERLSGLPDAQEASAGAGPGSTEEEASGRAVWVGSLGAGFVVLLDDGRAAFLREGEGAQILPGSFEPDLDGYAALGIVALARKDGRLCEISVGADGKAAAADREIRAEAWTALMGGWLWYSSGRLGYSRSGGASSWETATGLVPRYPPFAWNGRIVLCDYAGISILGKEGEAGLEASIREALVTEEAERSIAALLETLRERAKGGSLELEPFRKGARKGFADTWRVSVLSAESGLSHRFSVKGEGAYYIVVFDGEGNKLLSNQGYGTEESVELSLMRGKKYAVAFAPTQSDRDALPAELVVAVK